MVEGKHQKTEEKENKAMALLTKQIYEILVEKCTKDVGDQDEAYVAAEDACREYIAQNGLY